jgi:5'-3' exonuclease
VFAYIGEHYRVSSMGIENFNQIAKTYAANAFFQIPLAAFSGRRIAIDGNWYSHKDKSVSTRVVTKRHNVMTGPVPQDKVNDDWFRRAISFVSLLYYHNITPVFIFDGKAPDLKYETQKSRKQVTEKRQSKIDELEEQIDAYRAMAQNGSILDQPPADLIAQYKKLVSAQVTFSPDDRAVYRQLLQSIGVPVLQSTTEGERLASMLALDGLVDAVHSTDTDVVVHGCPLLITEIVEVGAVWMCQCVRVDYIRQGFNMTQEELVDFAIAAECDYNDGIPGIGAKKIFPLMSRARFIENIPSCDPTLDISKLKFAACRKLFEYVPPQEICEDRLYDEQGKLMLEVNKAAMMENYDWLTQIHLEGLCYSLSQAMSHLLGGTSQSSTLRELNLSPPVRYSAITPW